MTQVPFLMMWRKADVYASFWKPRAICLCSMEPSATCFCAFPIKEKASSWLWQNWFNCICWLQPKSEGLRISCLQVSEYFDRHLAFSHTGGASFCCANVCILQSWRWHWEDPGVGRKSLAAPGKGQPQQIVWTVRQLLIQMRSALCGVASKFVRISSGYQLPCREPRLIKSLRLSFLSPSRLVKELS